jgi:hypothetical protein
MPTFWKLFQAAIRSCVWLFLITSGSIMAQPVEVVSPELRGAVQPQVAVAPNGNIYVTFGKASSVYCAVSTNGGKTFHRPVEVASLPKLALGMRRGPRVVASNHQITISAISHGEGNLYAWTSGDDGGTWSKAVRINSITNSAREGLHAMAGDGRGNVYAVWLDLRNQGTELWGAGSHDGGNTWSRDVLIYHSPDGHICECCHPSVDVAPSGMIRVMWRNWLAGARDMYTAGSSDGGRTFDPATKLGSGTWPLPGCPMDGGSIAGPISIWRRNAGVYYTDDKSGEHLLEVQGAQPVVAIGKAGACCLWQRNSQLMLNMGTGVKPTVFAEAGAYPAVAAGSEYQMPIVVWESTTNGVKTILAQVLK